MGQVSLQGITILSQDRQKKVSGLVLTVQIPGAALRLETCDICGSDAQISASTSSLLRNRSSPAHLSSSPPMKHSPFCIHDRGSLADTIQRSPRWAARGLIWLYRHTLSPLVGYNCRHLPTCSVYADEAIDRFGLWAGGWMTLARLLRCQPFGTSGIDNVLLTVPSRARWYMPWRFARWRGVNGS